MAVVARYFRIWRRLAGNSIRTQLSTSLGSAGYLVGKILRLFFFLGYLLAIFKQLPSLKGYTVYEVVLFFMTFNIIDVSAQFLFRGLYGVKYLIEEGDFDKILTQPAHALFRISAMGVDLLDLLTLLPIAGVTAWTLRRLPHPVHAAEVAVFVALIANAMVIAYAFHVFVGALSVRTQELESAIWIYRDVMTLGRFPISIYQELMRGLFVTLVPVGVMVSFPAQALLGLLSWRGVAYAVALAFAFHLAAQAFWKSSLREYTSIST
ncbi:MAG: ABC-2 family transporter protein [Elusimicrobia bacterium]|nr:ABC-2 family transporter protein [Elusimicrobiota bacterium]